MANTSRVNGFKPVKHITGAPYNGQANIYEIPAGEAMPVMIGDLVVLSNSAATAGYPAVELALTASATADTSAAAVVGAVVGIINAKLDPDAGMSSSGLTTGSISLDTPIYRAASTKQFVLVADSPDLIFEAEANVSVANASVGLNTFFATGAINTAIGSTGASTMYVNSSVTPTTTATLPLQIVGFAKRVNNEAAETYNKVLVRINTHAYGSVGVAGV